MRAYHFSFRYKSVITRDFLLERILQFIFECRGHREVIIFKYDLMNIIQTKKSN